MKRRPWWTPRISQYNRGDLEMMFGFRYCQDPKGGPGYIYLPRKNDKYGAENRGTICCKDDQDGLWHYATEAWRQFVLRAVGRP
jgi:hypothetical protein